jgi:hypothetical protein
VPLLVCCDNFLYEELSRARCARHGQGRSNLDKGTLAAAHIGLVRAGQRAARSPDSLRAAAPCQGRCSVRTGVPVAGWFTREKRRDGDDQDDDLGGNDGGTVHAGGIGKSRALPGGSPTGSASRRLADRPPSPRVAGGPPLRARRHQSRA